MNHTVPDIGRIHARRVIRDVLPVAGLALADHHPMPREEDIEPLLVAALTVIDCSMPPELPAQDKRVVAAKDLLQLMQQTR